MSCGTQGTSLARKTPVRSQQPRETVQEIMAGYSHIGLSDH
ncbi:hypothetical protein GXM_08543 [Nostoc sphaeroides CCNUC1]|uniref:Uncharacterized protein n=1 Tax=Nostoc sphaeroides CCNUC1 TaxID=2653204 RepID=A0A5P8WGW1_9NOSO|nr:hypothetical protein GXM_08543 [Nostoc sphaeroides CCNUC1]